MSSCWIAGLACNEALRLTKYFASQQFTRKSKPLPGCKRTPRMDKASRLSQKNILDVTKPGKTRPCKPLQITWFTSHSFSRFSTRWDFSSFNHELYPVICQHLQPGNGLEFRWDVFLYPNGSSFGCEMWFWLHLSESRSVFTWRFVFRGISRWTKHDLKI